MKKIFAALACAFALTGCITSSMPTQKELQSFSASNSAIIAAGYDGSALGCFNGTLVISPVDGAGTTFITSLNGDPGAVMVPAGKYNVSGSSCAGAQYSYTLPNVDRWFMPVEVKARDVIYLGTFLPKSVTVQTVKSEAEKAGEAFLTLGLSLLTGPSNNYSEFPTYEFANRLVLDRPALSKGLGELSNRMVVRKPFQVLSPASFAAAYQRAYAPKEDGTLLTDEEANARLNIELKRAVAESLNKIMADVKRAQALAPPAHAEPPPAPPAPKIN